MGALFVQLSVLWKLIRLYDINFLAEDNYFACEDILGGLGQSTISYITLKYSSVCCKIFKRLIAENVHRSLSIFVLLQHGTVRENILFR